MDDNLKGNTQDNSNLDEAPKELVVIPIMSSPLFPGMIAPIVLTEDKFIPELENYITNNKYIALNLVKSDTIKKKDSNPVVVDNNLEEKNDQLAQEDISLKHISANDIYRVGVLCKIVKQLKLPDGSVNILVHGLKRYRASDIIKDEPLIIVNYEIFNDILEEDDELDAYTRSIINQVKKLSEINPYFNEEMKLAMLNTSSPGGLADLVAFSLSLDIPEAQDFLETLVVKKRFAKLLVYLRREKDVADIQKKISDEVSDKVNKYQREYFLREQLKVIQSELGIDKDDKFKEIKKIKDKIKDAGMSEDVIKAINDEVDRLELIPDTSPEYNITRTYLNWIAELPWNTSTEDRVDIDNSKKILDRDHYGLEKAKERVLEFLAVRALKPQFDGALLCFSGPPGVGKTSLGKSIATSLGRKFYRFSLGGMRDEAEIKGHRRTYVGAMPGKIIQAIKRVGVNNPVIMLDEIDKIGASYQGDPASALLEVLDPEQNSSFIDNYLDIPFDLSKVLFIGTANYIANIPPPLLDRMEVIELSGYTLEEKQAIAKKWVIPKQISNHGLSKDYFSMSLSVIKKLISNYCREPGVRAMEQYISKLCRKAALEKVKSKSVNKKFSLKEKDLEKYLGSPCFQTEIARRTLQPGVVTGLAWTAYGGEILFIETIPIKGNRGFKLTGQLGDIMNESANIAYSYVRKLLQNRNLDLSSKKKKIIEKDTSKKATPSTFLDSHEVHLHLPAGATPKDGPSAGITMALALYSLANNRKIKNGLAMTGELSLTGKILPVGGIKEKILAAKRAGIKSVIIPSDNMKDIKEVPERHRKGLKIFYVSHFKDVLKVAI